MKTTIKLKVFVLVLSVCTFAFAMSKKVPDVPVVPVVTAETTEKPMITFIELGSVNCIPCKMMQPVMKEIEEKYKGSVKVIFYDVWTKEQKQYAEKYSINVIPTQVFLDKDGKEFFRHEGFFPKEDIEALFEKNGIKADLKAK